MAKMTGTQDTHYNLVSVLYHALQAAETCEKYIADADKAGDGDLSQFFRRIIDTNRKCAQEAQQLLLARTGSEMAGSRR